MVLVLLDIMHFTALTFALLQAPKDWQLFMIAFLIVFVDLVCSLVLLIPDILNNDVGFADDKERHSEVNVSNC